jgi:8-oxo-dGTP pyrophosphatase MutT (NUDIX family)
MAEILHPRPAATVLALRDGDNGYEVLMLRRNLKSDFVGGAYVFPGGGVDSADAAVDLQRLVLGLNDEQASRRLGLERGGLAYYVACLRELFEEAGLLIVCDERGGTVELVETTVVKRLAAHRKSINGATMSFLEMLQEEELVLDLRGLAYLAHWVTPIGPPRRYDTRFFVALAPTGQIAAHDAGETVEDHWLRPSDALLAFERHEFDMILPTIRNLQAVAHFALARDVLDYANSLKDIPRIEPRMEFRDAGVVIVMPDGEEFSA